MPSKAVMMDLLPVGIQPFDV